MNWCKPIFATAPSDEDMRHIDEYADRMIERHGADIDKLVDRLAHEINLDATTRRPRRVAGQPEDRRNGIIRRGATCWSTISVFRSGTC